MLNVIFQLNQHDRQGACSVTSRRFRASSVSFGEKQQVLNILNVCLYSCLSYPARKSDPLRCFILLSMACRVVAYFSTLSHKRHDFREKKVIKRKVCVLIFSTTSFRKFSHSEENSARYYHECK